MAQREATFGDDLGASLSAWRTAPALPLLTVALAVLFNVSYLVGSAGVFVAFPAALLSIGWLDTQRVWYLRLFRRNTLEPNLLWSLTWAFVGRYFVLGLLFGIPFALVIVPIFVALSGTANRALVTVPIVFVGDFIFTFVTSALAFSTRRVSEALSIGWRTLWDGWPATAPYALVAPLVVIGLGQSLGRTIGGPGSLAVELLGTLLALVCKGATTAYYLRVHPVGDYGAAVVG